MRTKKLLALVLSATVCSSLIAGIGTTEVKANDGGKVEVTEGNGQITIGNEYIERTFTLEGGKVKTKEIVNSRANTTFTPEEGSEEFLISTKKQVDKGWKLVSVSSEEKSSENGAAINAFDGDPNTMWHTKYSGGVSQYPHHIAIDLGEEKELTGFTYLPRQSGTNGDIKDYEIYVSNDAENWGEPVKTGTFQYNGKNKISIKFDDVVKGKYIKLVGKNAVNGQAFGAAAEIDIIENGAVEEEIIPGVKTSDLELGETRVVDSAEDNGKRIIFDFKPYIVDGVEWDIDMNVVMENGDHFMRKYLEIKVDGGETTPIDYIDLEHLIVGEDDGPTWSRPDMQPAFMSGYQTALGQPVYINGMFYGSEFPQTDNRIVDTNEGDLAHFRYFTGKTFDQLDKTEDGKYVTWQTVAGAARSTDESVIQSDFFSYIDTISTRTNFRKQYNSWYDHMLNITSDNIQGSFNEIEKGLSQHGVEPVDAYVVDDGWNNYNGDFWSFNNKFPNELYDATEFTEKVSSKFGLWLGPRGGYNWPSSFAQNMERAGKGGYNPAGGDVCVGHPEYIKNITALFLDYMNRFDINYWKLDGFLVSPCPVKTHGHMTGGDNGMYMVTDTYEQWVKVFEAMRESREAQGKDLFINMTCYASPSPWFLQWVNTVWLQNSNDVGFASGDGGPVQKVDGSYMDAMLTYRDDRYFDFYRTRQFQFPAANIYNHDPIYGNTNTYGGGPVTMNTEQFRKYLFMLMSRGTAFWELYYSYNMMDDEKWAVNAEVLKWGEENFDILRNAKLIGETPKNGNVYGYSAWNGADGIVSLRNPSSVEKTYTLTLDRLIGVGEGAENLSKTTVYPYGVKEDDRTYNYGDTITVTLKPHEVLIWQFGAE
ncbi:discoidin domain-containing protein, partial [Clostridium sp.]|uniref:discoidin domain-containing protein n=1 Tax=Clostridium sp. TaxID=1506 RepID=UPI003F3FFC96